MRNQYVLNQAWVEKKNEVKTFFDRLSIDPALQESETCKTDEHLADWLSLVRYPLHQEISYHQGIYEDKTYRPLTDQPVKSVNVALLLDMVFEKMGVQGNVNDLMNHINNGGTLEGFMTEQDKHSS
ncbi:hypothetical protein [Paenibacillus kandeliae]|uniref:hypothetical protein n=1 Tax=Paenibacillus kandeliae TaxID=3231269 RepID=UPI003457D5E1